MHLFYWAHVPLILAPICRDLTKEACFIICLLPRFLWFLYYFFCLLKRTDPSCVTDYDDGIRESEKTCDRLLITALFDWDLRVIDNYNSEMNKDTLLYSACISCSFPCCYWVMGVSCGRDDSPPFRFQWWIGRSVLSDVNRISVYITYGCLLSIRLRLYQHTRIKQLWTHFKHNKLSTWMHFVFIFFKSNIWTY